MEIEAGAGNLIIRQMNKSGVGERGKISAGNTSSWSKIMNPVKRLVVTTGFEPVTKGL